MASSAKVANLRKRIRVLAADAPRGIPATAPQGFGTGPGRRSKISQPPEMTAKQQAIHAAVSALDEYLNRIVTSVNIIEAPTKSALNQALASAKKLGDQQMAQKATQKFQRIFGEMFSALDVVRSHIAPIVAETSAVREGEKELDARGAKSIVDALSAALPMVRSAFKTVDPKGHESAIEAEIQKQGHFLTQIKKVMNSTGTENPETQKKLQLAADGAEFYLENLRTLADPEYADRIQNNVEKCTTQHIPGVIQAAKALAKEFGATERAASILQTQKRLRVVAKRIVLLAYLRSKSL